MKLSIEELKKAFRYAAGKEATAEGIPVTDEELSLLKEMLKQMPDRAVRHLDYGKIKKELENISSDDIAEKFLARRLVDKIFEQPGGKDEKET